MSFSWDCNFTKSNQQWSLHHTRCSWVCFFFAKSWVMDISVLCSDATKKKTLDRFFWPGGTLDTMAQVKLQLLWLPVSGKANDNKLTGKCDCKERKAQRKTHVADAEWRLSESCPCWERVSWWWWRECSNGMIVVHNWGQLHCDPPPPVTLSSLVQHNPSFAMMFSQLTIHTHMQQSGQCKHSSNSVWNIHLVPSGTASSNAHRWVISVCATSFNLLARSWWPCLWWSRFLWFQTFNHWVKKWSITLVAQFRALFFAVPLLPMQSHNCFVLMWHWQMFFSCWCFFGTHKTNLCEKILVVFTMNTNAFTHCTCAVWLETQFANDCEFGFLQHPLLLFLFLPSAAAVAAGWIASVPVFS